MTPVIRSPFVFVTAAISLGLLIVASIALASSAEPSEDPPLPASEPEPAGKPQYDASPTPDPVQATDLSCEKAQWLCEAAKELLAARAAGRLGSLLAPTTIVCPPDSLAPGRPMPVCSARDAGMERQGFSLIGRSASFVDSATFESWLTTALRVNDVAFEARAVAVGCAIPRSQIVDCSNHGAVTIQLTAAGTGLQSGLFVLFVRRSPEGNWGLVGGTGAVSSGPVTDGGPERRILAGWIGSETGDWYFQRLK